MPNDKCARRACSNRHDNCLHTQMQTKYCLSCARKINSWNPSNPPLVTIPPVEELKRGRATHEDAGAV